ncbi:ScpA family protein [Magnetospira thiophila]
MDDFEQGDLRRESEGPRGFDLVLDLEGFEGPLDVLLTLARDQKVDLIHISILNLAEQYLRWITEMRRANLELAADYLVMAAWLAYLKSRLLLPAPPGEAEPSGEEMAAALQFQLQRLESMQEAGVRMMARPRLGEDFFARGMPEDLSNDVTAVYDLTLYDLLKAYADHKRREEIGGTLHITPVELYSVEAALERLRKLMGDLVPDWQTLANFLPEGLRDPLLHRSAVAATFVASLELAKEGQLELRQTETYGDIQIRRALRAGQEKKGGSHG